MKGPGVRLDLDVRRIWKCPQCGLLRKTAGSVSATICRCQPDGVWMSLVEPPRPKREKRAPAQPIPDDDADSLSADAATERDESNADRIASPVAGEDPTQTGRDASAAPDSNQSGKSSSASAGGPRSREGYRSDQNSSRSGSTAGDGARGNGSRGDTQRTDSQRGGQGPRENSPRGDAPRSETARGDRPRGGRNERSGDRGRRGPQPVEPNSPDQSTSGAPRPEATNSPAGESGAVPESWTRAESPTSSSGSSPAVPQPDREIAATSAPLPEMTAGQTGTAATEDRPTDIQVETACEVVISVQTAEISPPSGPGLHESDRPAAPPPAEAEPVKTEPAELDSFGSGIIDSDQH